MTGIIEQINAISVTNTYKLHDLLDRVLSIQNTVFANEEIRLDQQRVAFVSDVDDHVLLVQRDMNTFNVIARVIKDNEIVAECVISIDGEFKENYARMDAALKAKVSTWFTGIGSIDTTDLQDDTDADVESPAVDGDVVDVADTVPVDDSSEE